MATEPFMTSEITEILELMERDRFAGLKRLREVANSGNPTAILYYALSFSEQSGQSGQENDEIEWLSKAYELGFADAAWNMAMIYNQNKDFDNMKIWIDRTAELGNDDAVLIREKGYDVNEFLAQQRH